MWLNITRLRHGVADSKKVIRMKQKWKRDAASDAGVIIAAFLVLLVAALCFASEWDRIRQAEEATPQTGGPRSVAAASECANGLQFPSFADATERVPPVYGGCGATDTKRKAR